jgi:hypothetical protein
MAKIHYCILTVLLLSFSSCDRVHKNDLSKDLAVNDTELVSVIESDVVETIPAEESITNEPEVLLEPVKMTLPEIYLSQVGVREATGKNDGPEVEMYLRSVGLGKGYPYCSAFVAWCLNEAEIPHRINAWSPTAENRNHFIYVNKKTVKQPQAGDVFTIYYTRLKRIGHTGFYHENQNESIMVTVEANTNNAGSREGDGVYKKYRSLNTIHSISRWEK